MSVESAKAFIERMKTDEDFAKQVIACPDNEARISFVYTAGFNFTKEELDTLRSTLTDDDLAAVGGGFVVHCGPNSYGST